VTKNFRKTRPKQPTIPFSKNSKEVFELQPNMKRVGHSRYNNAVRYSSEQTSLKTYIRPVRPNHVLNCCYVNQRPSNVNISSCKNGTNPRSAKASAELHILGKLNAHYTTKAGVSRNQHHRCILKHTNIQKSIYSFHLHNSQIYFPRNPFRKLEHAAQLMAVDNFASWC
jgi:hypothetical protein